jgi:hypothetical protein
MCLVDWELCGPYGTPAVSVGQAYPTLKRGANDHCAYGAVALIPGSIEENATAYETDGRGA